MKMYGALVYVVVLAVVSYAHSVPPRPQLMGFEAYKVLAERAIESVDKAIKTTEDTLRAVRDLEMQHAPRERIVQLLGQAYVSATIPPYLAEVHRVAEPDATLHAREIQELKDAYRQKRERINDIQATLKRIATQYGIPEKEWESARISW